jgi:hypothetical protein
MSVKYYKLLPVGRFSRFSETFFIEKSGEISHVPDHLTWMTKEFFECLTWHAIASFITSAPLADKIQYPTHFLGLFTSSQQEAKIESFAISYVLCYCSTGNHLQTEDDFVRKRNLMLLYSMSRVYCLFHPKNRIWYHLQKKRRNEFMNWNDAALDCLFLSVSLCSYLMDMLKMHGFAHVSPLLKRHVISSWRVIEYDPFREMNMFIHTIINSCVFSLFF